jgi:transcriptional regulator with XRE-family HTH domain
MELREKLLQARKEAGLSQRQLCGEVITRNMLSQIEHGTARPSMDTLCYLAERLGKPVSYFLEEEGEVSRNRSVMEAAVQAGRRGDYAAAMEALKDYQAPDGIYDREKALLEALLRLSLAEAAAGQGRCAYALQLLSEPVAEEIYCAAELERRRLLLLGTLGEDPVRLCRQLPNLDGELLLRSRAALSAGNGQRALALLEACENREKPEWHFLKGQSLMRLSRYEDAAACLRKVEDVLPRETAPLLEVCFRELGDFRQAYTYACKQR